MTHSCQMYNIIIVVKSKSMLKE